MKITKFNIEGLTVSQIHQLVFKKIPEKELISFEDKHQTYYGQGIKIEDKKTGKIKAYWPHGIGVQKFKNGDLYSGNFANAEWINYGIYIKDNDYIYEGSWLKNEMTIGELRKIDGSDVIYKGKFKKKYFREGTVTVKDKIRYEGKVNAELMPHGKGKVTALKDIKNNEKFIFNRSDMEKGEMWEGTFDHGWYHGIFKITYADGDIWTAKFDKGKLIKDPEKLKKKN
jgi:hypothetical protein